MYNNFISRVGGEQLLNVFIVKNILISIFMLILCFIPTNLQGTYFDGEVNNIDSVDFPSFGCYLQRKHFLLGLVDQPFQPAPT